MTGSSFFPRITCIFSVSFLSVIISYLVAIFDSFDSILSISVLSLFVFDRFLRFQSLKVSTFFSKSRTLDPLLWQVLLDFELIISWFLFVFFFDSIFVSHVGFRWQLAIVTDSDGNRSMIAKIIVMADSVALLLESLSQSCEGFVTKGEMVLRTEMD